MKSRRHIIAFFIICILTGCGIGIGVAWYNYSQNNLSNPNSVGDVTNSIIESLTPEPPSAKIIFVGDLMVDRGVELSVNNNLGGDFGKLFDNIRERFMAADGVFLNLEGPVTDRGPNVGSKYSFAMDKKIIPALTEANVKMVSFANNHVGDRSNLGFTTTLDNLEEYNLPYTGAGRNYTEASAVGTQKFGDLTVGFIACSDVGPEWMQAKESTAGQFLCNDARLPEYISSARDQVDFLVFSAHWGTEYKPKTKRQQTLAYMAIDNGADIVIGHHPHIVQETEWYKDKFIAYSLGNFIFDQYFSKETMRGLMVEAEIEKHLIKNITLSIIELDPSGNKYQPKTIRPATEKDFLKTGSVSAQTCPASKEADVDKWLYPVGPDLDIGNYVPKNLITLTNQINVQTTSSCLTEKTATALVEMVNAMSAKGLSLIMTSGFRTRGTQEHIHSSNARTQEALLDPTKFPSVALPGRSEHRSGLQ